MKSREAKIYSAKLSTLFIKCVYDKSFAVAQLKPGFRHAQHTQLLFLRVTYKP